MSWTERECVECGTYVSFGIYYSEHEHDDTEISVTVKCGYCVNGTTYEEEQMKGEEMNFEKFREDGSIDTVDISQLSDEYIRIALEQCRNLYNNADNEFDREDYLRAFYTVWKSVS